MAWEKLDVLVYPDLGMEPLTYFMAFARLAPVQVRQLPPGVLRRQGILVSLASGPTCLMMIHACILHTVRQPAPKR